MASDGRFRVLPEHERLVGEILNQTFYIASVFTEPMGWSIDGRYLTYFTTDLSGGILYVLPLTGDGEQKPIEAFRSTFTVQGARLSPDSRFLSYMSNQSGRSEMYVRPVDLSGKGSAPNAGPWQISTDGGQGMGFWRQDGREFYYLAADRGFMAVNVSVSPDFEFGKPRLLFRLPESVPVAPGNSSVSHDGERFVVATPAVPTLQQITVFDRQGKVLTKVAELGRYADANLSPDGTRVAVTRINPRNNWLLNTGQGQQNSHSDVDTSHACGLFDVDPFI
jgi:Tol biopolymer transport system component